LIKNRLRVCLRPRLWHWNLADTVGMGSRPGAGCRHRVRVKDRSRLPLPAPAVDQHIKSPLKSVASVLVASRPVIQGEANFTASSTLTVASFRASPLSRMATDRLLQGGQIPDRLPVQPQLLSKLLLHHSSPRLVVVFPSVEGPLGNGGSLASIKGDARTSHPFRVPPLDRAVDESTPYTSGFS
jgi:hypothetical protein